MKFATKAIHAGSGPDPSTGAIMPPIYMTSTFVQDVPGETREGYDYTRAGNPNFTILENGLAALEGAQYATVFSSGLGALTGLISTLSQGDRVLAFEGVYGGTYRLFNAVFKKFGIDFQSIVPTTSEVLEKALRSKPKWLFFETPTNPVLEVYDIAAYAKLAKQHGVMTIVDNTFATPYFQNPLSLGADAVWHSSTKYIGGHSDVIGGVVMTNDQKMKSDLDFARKAIGLNPSPFDAWLLTRGLKTLAVRMKQHEKNALAIANFFQNHPKIHKVHYPGLTSHPHHGIAKKQMSGFSGMVSTEFKLPFEKIKVLVSSFSYISLAESLGGVESLVCHPASMTHASIPAEEWPRTGLTNELVRFSIGIEDIDDLLEDLENGLKPF